MNSAFRKMRKEWKHILFNIVFAILNLTLVIIFYKNILLTSVLLFILALIGLFIWRSNLTLAIFIFGALFGTFSEVFAVSYDVWSYSLSNFLNIPLWLFFIWGNASAFIYRMAIEFERLGFHR